MAKEKEKIETLEDRWKKEVVPILKKNHPKLTEDDLKYDEDNLHIILANIRKKTGLSREGLITLCSPKIN